MNETQSLPQKKKRLLSVNRLLIVASLVGLLCGFFEIPGTVTAATGLSTVIIDLLKLISLPMIFFSICSSVGSMRDFAEIRNMGRRVLFYAFVTTFFAAVVGLILFLAIRPTHGLVSANGAAQIASSTSYLGVLKNIVPSNAVRAFLENNAIGIMLMAVAMGIAILTLPEEPKRVLRSTFSGLFGAILSVTRWLVYLMPVGVWAFCTLLVVQIKGEDPSQLRSFCLYLICVVSANLLQAFVVLPFLMKFRGLSPWKLFKAVSNALTLAFFTRSSNAVLPVTLQATQEKAGVSPRVANFSIPLCATINMNACAAFILITVFYVSMANGVVFSTMDYMIWLFIATAAAIGNAGVPMGCYFLSGALLTSMDVPLTLLGLILPAYTLIDMLETAVNVWSDCCVTTIVDKELKAQETLAVATE